MQVYLTVALYNQQRFADARAVTTPLLGEARAFYGNGDPWLGLSLSVAGNLEVVAGDPLAGDALLGESNAISAASQEPDHPNTRASEADRTIARVVAGDWPEARRRLATIIGWLDGTGRGDSVLAHYLRTADAHVLARQQSTPQRRAALRELLASTEDRWSDVMHAHAQRWMSWAERVFGKARWLYVAFVIDVFARRIVGWRVSDSMRTDFVLDAPEQGLYARRPERDGALIHLSDRGSQYVSIRYSERLAEAGIEPSVGSCGDSARSPRPSMGSTRPS